MKRVTLLEFRKNAPATLDKVAGGQTIVLTRRGRAIARRKPLSQEQIEPDDPIYAMAELAADGIALTNEQMHREIYGF